MLGILSDSLFRKTFPWPLKKTSFYLDISSPVQFSSPAMTCSVFSSWSSIIGELISLINLFRTFPSIVAYMLISWLHAFPYLISNDTYLPLRSIFPTYISYFILSQHRIITPFLWEDPELHVQYPSHSLLNLNLPCLWWQCISCSKWVFFNPTIDCSPYLSFFIPLTLYAIMLRDAIFMQFDLCQSYE